jgi:hypothetical protein
VAKALAVLLNIFGFVVWGLISLQVDKLELLSVSALKKLSSEVVSSHNSKPVIPDTTELFVRVLAEFSFDKLTNLDPCVTPATKIPTISITIESSIKEKAFCLVVNMDELQI